MMAGKCQGTGFRPAGSIFPPTSSDLKLTLWRPQWRRHRFSQSSGSVSIAFLAGSRLGVFLAAGATAGIVFLGPACREGPARVTALGLRLCTLRLARRFFEWAFDDLRRTRDVIEPSFVARLGFAARAIGTSVRKSNVLSRCVLASFAAAVSSFIAAFAVATFVAAFAAAASRVRRAASMAGTLASWSGAANQSPANAETSRPTDKANKPRPRPERELFCGTCPRKSIGVVGGKSSRRNASSLAASTKRWLTQRASSGRLSTSFSRSCITSLDSALGIVGLSSWGGRGDSCTTA
jgi:hypothetical protein